MSTLRQAEMMHDKRGGPYIYKGEQSHISAVSSNFSLPAARLLWTA